MSKILVVSLFLLTLMQGFTAFAQSSGGAAGGPADSSSSSGTSGMSSGSGSSTDQWSSSSDQDQWGQTNQQSQQPQQQWGQQGYGYWGQQQAGASGMGGYQRGQMFTVTGQVVQTDVNLGGETSRQLVAVQTQDGQRVLVDLSSAQGGQNLQSGQQIFASGPVQYLQGQPVLMAQNVSTQQQGQWQRRGWSQGQGQWNQQQPQQQQWGQQGYGYWGQQQPNQSGQWQHGQQGSSMGSSQGQQRYAVSGRITDTQVDLGDDSDNIVAVRNSQGQRVLVDTSNISSNDNIESGRTIYATGTLRYINGRPVLQAQSLMSQEQSKQQKDQSSNQQQQGSYGRQGSSQQQSGQDSSRSY